MRRLLLTAGATAFMLAMPAYAQTDDEIMEAMNAVSFYVVAANACRDENGGSERFEAALTASESLLVSAGAPPEQAKQVIEQMIEPRPAGEPAPTIDLSTCPMLTKLGSEKVKAVREQLSKTKPSTPIRPLPESVSPPTTPMTPGP